MKAREAVGVISWLVVPMFMWELMRGFLYGAVGLGDLASVLMSLILVASSYYMWKDGETIKRLQNEKT